MRDDANCGRVTWGIEALESNRKSCLPRPTSHDGRQLALREGFGQSISIRASAGLLLLGLLPRTPRQDRSYSVLWRYANVRAVIQAGDPF